MVEYEKCREQVERIVKRACHNTDVDVDVLLQNMADEWDATLTREENFNFIWDKLDKILGEALPTKAALEQDKAEYLNSIKDDDQLLTKDVLDQIHTIAIYGDIGTGKTALAYTLLELFKADKPIYFLKHPNPKIIKKLGYKNLRSLEEIERLQNCVIFWDEPQLTTSIYDNKTNSVIAKVCSLARQLNIQLIISSSDTRVFTKHNEAYFDMWLIKDVDYTMVKQGSKIKQAVRDCSKFEPAGFRLEINEFISESRKLAEFNGKHIFSLPSDWSEDHSKPYKTPNETAKGLANALANGLAKVVKGNENAKT